MNAFVEYMNATSNYKIRFVNIKQQAIRFTKGIQGGSILRNQLSVANDIDQLKKLLIQTIPA